MSNTCLIIYYSNVCIAFAGSRLFRQRHGAAGIAEPRLRADAAVAATQLELLPAADRRRRSRRSKWIRQRSGLAAAQQQQQQHDAFVPSAAQSARTTAVSKWQFIDLSTSFVMSKAASNLLKIRMLFLACRKKIADASFTLSYYTKSLVNS